VAHRVSPTEHVRAEMDALFDSDSDLAMVLEDVGRLTVRLVMQQAIEAEVDAFLGRARTATPWMIPIRIAGVDDGHDSSRWWRLAGSHDLGSQSPGRPSLLVPRWTASSTLR